jgi:PAS domain S-box-containing protein
MSQTPFPAGRWSPTGVNTARYLDSLPAPAWIKDIACRYVFANDAAVEGFGRSRNEIYGRTDEELFSAEAAESSRRNDAKALASGHPLRAAERVELRHGVAHMLVIRFPIRDATTTMLGGLALDISDHVEREEMLKGAVARKREFIATVAHELRNPLAPISTAVSILERLGGQTPEGTRLLNVIGRQAKLLAHLVEDLMDASRVASGRMGVRLCATNLVAVLRTALEMSRPQIEAAHHELHCMLPDQPLPVMADARRLAQVFANLLNNAAKFTAEGGKIRLIARRTDGRAEVIVSDNGIGMSAELLPRVFDLFAQANPRSDRTHGGLGVGLALVKRLVELHGGEVTARSEGLGKGSEFEVHLPLLPHAKLSSVSDESEPAERDGERVLVVDDNRDAADSLCDLLKLMGNEVAVAYDGKSALAMCEAFAPTLILIDIEMPAMDGYSLAQQLRPCLHGRPMLVALTGLSGDESRRRSTAAGFDYHLVKPVDIESLNALIAANRREPR